MKVYVVTNDQGEYGVEIVGIYTDEADAKKYSSKEASDKCYGYLNYM